MSTANATGAGETPAPDHVARGEFTVVAREPGAENPAIPTWANGWENPLELARRPDCGSRIDVEGLPGTFQVRDVLDAQECARLVALSESLGYVPDAAVSLPRSIRHNDSLTWVVDDVTSRRIFERCAAAIDQGAMHHGQRRSLGLNNRFRFYRYGAGDYFSPHTDGAWPGSRVLDGNLVTDAWGDRWSELTFLLFLTGDYDGGLTRFHRRGAAPGEPVEVRTPIGWALCFPHGTHPLHCVHESTPVTRGTKMIIRSDVLYPI